MSEQRVSPEELARLIDYNTEQRGDSDTPIAFNDFGRTALDLRDARAEIARLKPVGIEEDPRGCAMPGCCAARGDIERLTAVVVDASNALEASLFEAAELRAKLETIEAGVRTACDDLMRLFEGES